MTALDVLVTKEFCIPIANSNKHAMTCEDSCIVISD